MSGGFQRIVFELNYSTILNTFLGFNSNHPQNSVRIAFNLPILSVIFGVISVIIDIVPVL